MFNTLVSGGTQNIANIAAVTGLIKRDVRLTVKNIANSVGILSGSAHKIFASAIKTRKGLCSVGPQRLT